jgi:hypothetical protein
MENPCSWRILRDSNIVPLVVKGLAKQAMKEAKELAERITELYKITKRI